MSSANPQRESTSAASSFTPPTVPLSCLFFFSGALALIYEALWQRRFALVFGSAAPATAAVLAAYFAGLALGSFAIGNRVHKFSSPLKVYAILECGIAVGAILVEPLLHIFDLIQSPASGPTLLILKTVLAFIALALPTICMGGTFPVLGAFIDEFDFRGSDEIDSGGSRGNEALISSHSQLSRSSVQELRQTFNP